MRSTQPTRSSHTPSNPVSSASSRTTASASVSPPSTRPPGTDHSPAAGPWPRRMSSSRSSTTATAPTHVWALTSRAPLPLEPVVHDQLAGGEARLLEEVLRGPVAGQGHGVHPHALALLAPGHEVAHHELPQADLAGLLLHEDVVDDAQDRPVGQGFEVDHGVADDHLVDGGHHEPGLGVVEQGAEAVLD